MTQSSRPQTGNFAIFMLLAFGILMANAFFFHKPEKPQADKQGVEEKVADEQVADEQVADKAADGKLQEKAEPKTDVKRDGPPAKDEDVAEKEMTEPKRPKQPIEGDYPKTEEREHWVTLGSGDPESPYRMLVTLTDRGAAVERIELNSPRYVALTDPNGFLSESTGYLGYLALEGTRVRVVAPGTPADKAGLKPGDRIEAVNGEKTATEKDIKKILSKTKPKKTIELSITRDGKPMTISATLGRFPLEVVRPETMNEDRDHGLGQKNGQDPLSYLLTMAQVDGEILPETIADPEAPKDVRPAYVEKELPGVNLRKGTWKIGRHSETMAEFICELPQWDIEIVKTYRLKEVPAEEQDNADFAAYNLTFAIEIRNVGKASREIAYQLDGPTGLPIEGWWYGNKVGRVWSAGLRDLVISFGDENGKMNMVGCPAIAADDFDKPWRDKPVSRIGIDAQYFASVLIPQKESAEDIWFAQSQPLRVGPVDPEIKKITDTSFRVRSLSKRLEAGESLSHEFEIFAGPKRPPLLDQYGLGELVYYGWFSICAKPMVAIVHFFYSIVCNYGLAIIMLTVLVRGLMFPLSHKQALGAQKMAELQPEIKKLQEKYKKDLEARGRAQRELFQKHNYNPMSGCLVVFIQLPIFIGLYRGLMVDVELRGSSLFGTLIPWCSNLAAPDMLFNWMSFMPGFITSGIGMFGLGPYFNLLPILTIFLFIAQQKLFMPPAVDEQQAMQQKMMKYMMIFMGLLFFKVAAGLCIYFIASSAWGLCERKLLPKPAHKTAAADAKVATPKRERPWPSRDADSRFKGKNKGRGRR